MKRVTAPPAVIPEALRLRAHCDVSGALSLARRPSVACIIGRTLTTSSAMPVTAKLSKNFYDLLGEPVANELVDWFNAVDQTYRSELRELNELNFARFDAKLEQRLAEVKSELLVMIERRASETDAKLERRLSEQTRWMFVFWATQMLAIVGLLARR